MELRLVRRSLAVSPRSLSVSLSPPPPPRTGRGREREHGLRDRLAGRGSFLQRQNEPTLAVRREPDAPMAGANDYRAVDIKVPEPTKRRSTATPGSASSSRSTAARTGRACSCPATRRIPGAPRGGPRASGARTPQSLRPHHAGAQRGRPVRPLRTARGGRPGDEGRHRRHVLPRRDQLPAGQGEEPGVPGAVHRPQQQGERRRGLGHGPDPVRGHAHHRRAPAQRLHRQAVDGGRRAARRRDWCEIPSPTRRAARCGGSWVGRSTWAGPNSRTPTTGRRRPAPSSSPIRPTAGRPG